MNPILSRILLISAKNAVNVLIVNSGLWLGDPEHFNLHSLSGVKHMAMTALWLVASREGTVWVPKILKWSQTNGDVKA